MPTRAQIIACGQRHIKSSKSGLTFPAFLVRFVDYDEEPEKEGDKSKSSSNNHNENDFKHDLSHGTKKSDIINDIIKKDTPHCVKLSPCRRRYRYYWRAKRDFLLLNRALIKKNTASSRKSVNAIFPKSVYSKLCEEAFNQSWVRPLQNNSNSEDQIHEIMKKLLNNPELTRNDLQDGIGFNIRMKKSLLRLDQFLQHAFNGCGNEKESDSEWVEGWTLFCRDIDTEHLIYPHHVQNDLLLDTEKVEDVRRAAKYGQYFASEQNATKVVGTAISFCQSQSYFNNIDIDLVFIEPSCGDGRIIKELISSLNHVRNRYCVLGYDIDEIAIKSCQEKLLSRTRDENSNQLFLHCCNFLDLTIEDILSH